MKEKGWLTVRRLRPEAHREESKSLPSIIQSCEMETSSKYDVTEIGRRRFGVVGPVYTERERQRTEPLSIV